MESVANLPESEKIRALEENLWSLWSNFGRGEGCVLHDSDELLRFDTPITQLPYNVVLRFRGGGDVEARIDAIFAHYQGRGVPFAWLIHPSSSPDDLGERLGARGFVEAEVLPGMVMDTREMPAPDPTPDGIEIREAVGDGDLAAALDLIAWRWDVSPETRQLLAGVTRNFHVGPDQRLRCWLAWRDGVPVSKVVINLDKGAVGLYGVATKPEARGLGLARILTLEAFAAARRDGHHLAVLHSTAMAYGLYEKLGFVSIAPFRVYAPADSFHF